MNIDQHLDRALRQEPDAGPPVDFAHSVAARVARSGARAERWLSGMAVLAFVAAAVHAGLRYGDAMMPVLAGLVPQSEPATALNWAAATGACLGLTWVVSRLRPTRPR